MSRLGIGPYEVCAFCHQRIVGNKHYLNNGGDCDPQLLSDDAAENVQLLRDDPKEYGRRLAYTAFNAWASRSRDGTMIENDVKLSRLNRELGIALNRGQTLNDAVAAVRRVGPDAKKALILLEALSKDAWGEVSSIRSELKLL